MDLQEFSQKFGIDTTTSFQYNNENFNLLFSRYENGNWCLNLISDQNPIGEINADIVPANELTVATKALLADDFIVISSQQQAYLKLLSNANVIINHPFFMEKVENYSKGRPVTKDAYQLHPDFITYIKKQVKVNLKGARNLATVGFIINKPSDGFDRIIFDRDRQLRDNPELALNNGGIADNAKSGRPEIAPALKVQATNVLEDLAYIDSEGNPIEVGLRVKKYAVDGAFYLELNDKTTQTQLVIISNHGTVKQLSKQVKVNLGSGDVFQFGTQISKEWLLTSGLFESVDETNAVANLSVVGQAVLQMKVGE